MEAPLKALEQFPGVTIGAVNGYVCCCACRSVLIALCVSLSGRGLNTTSLPDLRSPEALNLPSAVTFWWHPRTPSLLTHTVSSGFTPAGACPRSCPGSSVQAVLAW